MVFWIVGGRTGKDGGEVILEGVDRTFHFITLMDVWRHQLEGAVVGCDGALKGSADFIVQDVQRGRIVGSVEMVVQFCVGNAMGIVLGSKGLAKDGIGVAVNCHHDILVATV